MTPDVALGIVVLGEASSLEAIVGCTAALSAGLLYARARKALEAAPPEAAACSFGFRDAMQLVLVATLLAMALQSPRSPRGQGSGAVKRPLGHMHATQHGHTHAGSGASPALDALSTHGAHGDDSNATSLPHGRHIPTLKFPGPSMGHHNAPEERPNCPAWEMMRRLSERQLSQRGRRMAVCLTGQLRLFQIALPTLFENVLMRVSQPADLFYVGPKDISFEHAEKWLRTLPSLQNWVLYDPDVQFDTNGNHDPEAPIASFDGLMASSRRLAIPSPLPKVKFNLRSAVSEGQLSDNNFATVELGSCHALRSRLVQAFQAQQCLRLIEASERAAGNKALYSTVLRTRVDLVLPSPMALSQPLFATRYGFNPFTACPESDDSFSYHDFALMGTRELMGGVLSALDGLTVPMLKKLGCNGALFATGTSLTGLRARMPKANCESAANGSSLSVVATVRANVPDSCFFIDQIYPSGTTVMQHWLGQDTLSMAMARCIGLSQARDSRRACDDGDEQPGMRCRAQTCAYKGGWDGDFQTIASPWAERRRRTHVSPAVI